MEFLLNWLLKRVETLNKRLGTTPADIPSKTSVVLTKASIESEAEFDRLITIGLDYFDNEDWLNAIEQFKNAISLKPDNPKALYNLGCCYWNIDNFEEAKHYLTRAIDLNLHLYDTYYLLSMIASKQNQPELAISWMEKGIELYPTFKPGMLELSALYAENRPIAEAIAYLEKIMPELGDQPAIFSMLLFYLQSEGRLSQQALFDKHIEYAKKFEQPLLQPSYQFELDKSRDKRLRIGYVSGDFRMHSVTLFMEPILANHNEQFVETFCYHTLEKVDETTEKIKFLSDHFAQVDMLSEEDFTAKIREDKIDILVDLSGHTTGNRLMTFARKPAPVQVSYLGYIDTTGLQSMDYRLSSIHTDPPENDAYATEKLYRFSNRLWWTYRVFDKLPPLSPSPATQNGYLTFVSPNAYTKITGPMIKLWSDILKAIPTAKLNIMAAPSGKGREILIQRFAEMDADIHRIGFIERTDLTQYRLNLLASDIVLDTYPYNGGTTSCETLLLGLPMITLAGKSFVSRMGYALLKEIGHEELVAHTDEEYVNIALALSKKLDTLDELRASIRENAHKSSLLDEEGFTRDLESAYRQMWHAYLDSPQDNSTKLRE